MGYDKVNTDGTETYFFYDGANAVMEYDSGGNATAKYWHGPDGLVWMNKSATNMYVGCDHLGSVWNTVTLDAGETIKATYTYTAFGNTTASEVIPNNYRYVGKLGYYNDPESGMMLLGHRYYNPSVGRFTTLDPIKDGENWYAYVKNWPTTSVDPHGLACDRVSYITCMRKAKQDIRTALLGMIGAIGLVDALCVAGCILTGPGWLACVHICILIADMELIIAITGIAIAYFGAKARCNRLYNTDECGNSCGY